MSVHINKFIDRLRAAESRNQRDLVMTVQDAKNLHTDITRLLLQLNEIHQVQQEQKIQVEITSQSF